MKFLQLRILEQLGKNYGNLVKITTSRKSKSIDK